MSAFQRMRSNAWSLNRWKILFSAYPAIIMETSKFHQPSIKPFSVALRGWESLIPTVQEINPSQLSRFQQMLVLTHLPTSERWKRKSALTENNYGQTNFLISTEPGTEPGSEHCGWKAKILHSVTLKTSTLSLQERDPGNEFPFSIRS